MSEERLVPKLRFNGFEYDEWHEVKIEDKFDKVRNGFVGVATPYYVEKGIPYLQSNNIRRNKIDKTQMVYINKEFHEKHEKSMLKENDILVVQSGHAGECTVVPKEFEGCNCHALIIMSPNDVTSINEMVEVNLNGYNSRIEYVLKSIGENKESYDYAIFHNHKNTYSNIINNCINLKGITNIQISSSVKKDIVECVCNQYNRIINLTNNKCEIRPILYIDTDNVDANHSALIGDFESEELFYLETMGISRKEAYKLLIKGFLLNKINDDFLSKKIKDSIKKYWR